QPPGGRAGPPGRRAAGPAGPSQVGLPGRMQRRVTREVHRKRMEREDRDQRRVQAARRRRTRRKPPAPDRQAVRRPHRCLRGDGIPGRPHRDHRDAVVAGLQAQPARDQRRVQGDQEFQDRPLLPQLVLRQLPLPPRRQRGLHAHHPKRQARSLPGVFLDRGDPDQPSRADPRLRAGEGPLASPRSRMPDLKPYIVLGLAVGGVFSLSGVGIVVLYRATAVLNLAYGAIGAAGALLAYSLTTGVGLSTWLSVAIVVVFCGMLSLLYGTFFGAAFALREPLVKMIGTLGVLLILLGAMSMIWTSQAYSLTLPTTNWSFQVSGVNVTGTQLIGLVLGVAVTAATAALLRYTKLGAGMRALADDRQAAAILGVPVRRVEAAAWLASGLLAGVTGVLLSNLVAFDAADLTFLVVPALAAAVVGRLQSLWLTLIGGLVIGVIQSCVTAFNSVSDYSATTPFVVAIVVMLWFARRR